MKKEKNPIELLICECHSTDHQIILLYEYDEEYDENGNITKKLPMCYIHINLNNYMSFWKRLKFGIKYIFGYKSRYGAFDEFIFNPEDAPKLQKLVDYLNEQQIIDEHNR
ncbi:hypothetical protein M0Q97_04235 [Candidatus Dojkabacteria bacterium]|jgi:hypothetical protein|nr:hypothetical protein [Candidatus Dojkabacteria bacterium]